MAGQLVMKNTFWEVEMSPEELESTVQQRRQRAYTDMCFSFKSSDLGSFSTDLGSPTHSTEMGSTPASSGGSVAGDASDRWADICDTDDDDLPSPPSQPSRPSGTWFSPPGALASPPGSFASPPGVLASPPGAFMRPAGTWCLPPACSLLETQMAAAMGKAKERAAFEAKSAKAQTVEKQPQPKASCTPCERTTLVLRKLPKTVTRASLLEMLDTAGLKGLYDFVYLPMDFKKGKVFGYAIVNFVANESAESASSHFAAAGINTDWSDSHQGFDELIQRYRDSPIMHPSMPEISKPMIFCNGLLAPFPNPTKKVQPLPKN
jgi:hypothetical protein